MIKTNFYDVESLDNIFTCTSYQPSNDPDIPDKIHVYLLDDENICGITQELYDKHIVDAYMPRPNDPCSTQLYLKIRDTILAANPRLKQNKNVQPQISIINLKSVVGICVFANEMAVQFLDYNNQNIFPGNKYLHGKPKTSVIYESNIPANVGGVALDTIDKHVIDPNDMTNPYILGYNSYNYDITIIAALFSLIFKPSDEMDVTHLDLIDLNALTAKGLRRINDLMFTSDFKNNMPSVLQYLNPKLPSNISKKSIKEHNRQYHQWDEWLRWFAGDTSISQPTMQAWMRDWNSNANNFRRGMLMSGRHIDVSKLNEKMKKVGLKRLLGMLGYQILESDKLGIGKNHLETVDEVADLIAYNVSDVVYLQALFEDPTYASPFERNSAMLIRYPELVFESKQTNGKYNHDDLGKTGKVRKNRLFIDSTSQQLASRTLSPEGHLSDSKTVSLQYPSRYVNSGITPYNVLEFAHDFFKNEVLTRISDPDAKDKAYAYFMHVYNAYSKISGKNFNSSALQKRNYQNDPLAATSKSLPQVAKMLPWDMPYYDENGNETDCFATFSTGGVHGAQYNRQLFEHDLSEWQDYVDDITMLKDIFGHDDEGALAFRKSVRRLADPIEFDTDGNPITFKQPGEHYVKEFLTPKSTMKAASWRANPKPPQLFEYEDPEHPDQSKSKLKKKYTWTSAALVNHEDFSSYYPSLLRMMNVFYNPDIGYDRYGEMYEQKESLGAAMKDPSKTSEEKRRLSLDRNGVKLILNTASGAGDATFDNPILMNNNIIAMRIIGQLFTWYIGQYQALYGAKIVSTNTDGLYTVMEKERNNKLLEEAAEHIKVKIDPEQMYLISKDSNNRIEFIIEPDNDGSGVFLGITEDATSSDEMPIYHAQRLTTNDGKPAKFRVLSAAGGTLACRRGPDPQKSLAHPALSDWALGEYLMRSFARRNFSQDAMAEDFDYDLARVIVHEMANHPDVLHSLLMFQNVIASNPASNTYIFSQNLNPDELEEYLQDKTKSDADDITILQHYNRVFVVKDKAPDTTHLYVAAQRVPTDAIKNKRKRESGSMYYMCDSVAAKKVLEANGIDTSELMTHHDIVRKKFSGISRRWNMLIDNRDLHSLSEEELLSIRDRLDLEKYVNMVAEVYEKNWRNHLI